MANANASKYTAAQSAVSEGLWTVDPERGLVMGVHGRPIGTLGASPYLRARIPGKRALKLPTVLLHRVIWEASHGPLSSAMEINHKNGIKTDNRISNLEAVTPSENSQHAVDTGLRSTVGEGHHQARLTPDVVRDLYARCWAGESPLSLSLEYGVARTTVHSVKHGWSWKHVTGHSRGAAE